MFHIQDELKKLPAKPGVYLMHDVHDKIIYVGKAISLKNRVHQYFQPGRNVSPKIERMISQIDHFEYIITDSELEALVLESNLIKEYRPKYNTMLKDDKSYPFIKATVGEAYPRLLFVRKANLGEIQNGKQAGVTFTATGRARTPKKEKARYFGPYTSAGAVKDTLELIQKIYGLRTCNRVLPRDIGKDRPCLNYHIHQCAGPCQGYISAEEYQKRFSQALDFLNGKYDAVISYLTGQMQQAAEKMEYEKAAEYRDLLNSVKQVAQKQKITMDDTGDRDVLGIAIRKGADDNGIPRDTTAVVQVFFIRGGKMIGREHFYFSHIEDEKEPELIAAFIKQYYGGTPYIPKELYLPCDLPEEEKTLLEEWLTSRLHQKVTLQIPKLGLKNKLVQLAEKNAQLLLEKDGKRWEQEEKRTKGALINLAQVIGIPVPQRMESYDISNISGFQSVGSMVVFVDGKPKKNAYRKFRIKTVQGPDDYASMREVLTRRFTHGLEEQKELQEKGEDVKEGSFSYLPDLILMDGGKGQVNIALEVLDELHLNIPVCGMVKDDHHRTRGLYFQEKELPIKKDSEEFHLLTRIQDETHRFAIEYHRSLRSKEQVHSVLDDIPGIGPARRKALLRTFGSVEEIRNAEEEKLREVPGMNAQAAAQVYAYFHPEPHS